MKLRTATVADLPELGRALGAAFDDDPLLNWIVRQDERRAWAIETLFREVTRHAHIDEGESYLLEGGSGAAVWRPPGVEEPSGGPLNAIFDEIVGPRGREHSNLVGELIEGKHPESPPHFYLFAIGVDPSMQGAGAGSRLLRHVLDRCDRGAFPPTSRTRRSRTSRSTPSTASSSASAPKARL